ncbi:LppU/SCO3897 family protein [Nocardia asiatica]|uniref:LppU/SCO3897 family protein n=1 Tax=Nocardia asiatica TaxID=209252 RepID=UPI002454C970|nr:hypothetical protein [Nocardia asiatica]
MLRSLILATTIVGALVLGSCRFPSHPINAKVGSCLGYSEPSKAQTEKYKEQVHLIEVVACEDAEAEYRVLARLDHAAAQGLRDCGAYPEAVKYYTTTRHSGSKAFMLCLAKK